MTSVMAGRIEAAHTQDMPVAQSLQQPRRRRAALDRRAQADVLIHLRRARDLVDRAYSSALDLDALAQAAGMSKFHFLRLFRATYGMTPGQYISQRRLERSQELLRHTNLTVTEVCHAVGFTSLGTFCTRFRQLTGETPSQFQDRHARAGAPRIPGCVVFMWGLAERGAAGSAIEKKPDGPPGS
jgi:AraC-like DNA-binding protein